MTIANAQYFPSCFPNIFACLNDSLTRAENPANREATLKAAKAVIEINMKGMRYHVKGQEPKFARKYLFGHNR